jgi:hypothetical protein
MTIRVDSRVLVGVVVDRYRSNTVTQGQWLGLREPVRELLVAAEPSGEADVVALLSNLVRFLVEFSQDGSLSLGVLTLVNVDVFVERLRVAGTPVGTLQQVRPRLRRLVRAHRGEKTRERAGFGGPRVTVFDPLSDRDVQVVLGVVLPADQARVVRIAVALGDRFGLRGQEFRAARLCDGGVWVGATRVADIAPGDPVWGMRSVEMSVLMRTCGGALVRELSGLRGFRCGISSCVTGFWTGCYFKRLARLRV